MINFFRRQLLSIVLHAEQISKVYHGREQDVPVLDQLDLELREGDSLAVIGPSGSGKTTLLSLCAGLDQPSTGQVILLGRNLRELDENQRSALRTQEVGFIFQAFHLMPSLTALENVMLPLELAGRTDTTAARTLLDQVGLGNRLNHYPHQLSGGEQQRVAIARAFVNRPRILFADEPTGNLDRHTNDRIVNLIFELNREHGTALMLITHDEALAAKTQHLLYLRDGRLHEQAPVSVT